MRKTALTLVLLGAVASWWAFMRPVRIKTALKSAKVELRRLAGEGVERSRSGPVVLRPSSPATTIPRVDQPDILLLLIDTLRPDHLGAYGYARATSPFMDGLAREGAIFTAAISQSPWTKPSVLSLMTGLYPSDLWSPGLMGEMLSASLPEGPRTLAETLWEGGYQTVGLSDHPAISASRFGRGFEIFDLLPGGAVTDSGWSETPERIVEERWSRLLARSDGRPLFAYLHLIYPHLPYEPPPPYDALFGRGAFLIRDWQREGVLRLYDGEIRRTDATLERLMGAWTEVRSARKTVTLLTSDHGEGFWEHGLFEHGNSLFDELLRIPLIVHAPGLVPPGLQIHTVAQTVDIFPTISELTGMAFGDGRGRSLVGSLTSAAREHDDVFALSEFQHTGDARARSARSARSKIILAGDGSLQGYEVADDPGERAPRPVSMSTDLARLVDWMSAIRPRPGPAGDHGRQPGPEELERLRALGYVGASRPQPDR